jgi:hypothetical protein
MATYVNIHDNVAERGATLIQNVNVPTRMADPVPKRREYVKLTVVDSPHYRGH